jgi:hypothetical protein
MDAVSRMRIPAGKLSRIPTKSGSFDAREAALCVLPVDTSASCGLLTCVLSVLQ